MQNPVTRGKKLDVSRTGHAWDQTRLHARGPASPASPAGTACWAWCHALYGAQPFLRAVLGKIHFCPCFTQTLVLVAKRQNSNLSADGLHAEPPPPTPLHTSCDLPRPSCGHDGTSGSRRCTRPCRTRCLFPALAMRTVLGQIDMARAL